MCNWAVGFYKDGEAIDESDNWAESSNPDDGNNITVSVM